jgi:hypothetical protein
MKCINAPNAKQSIRAGGAMSATNALLALLESRLLARCHIPRKGCGFIAKIVKRE